jgi:hypothetical protein
VAAAQNMIDEAKHEEFDKRCGKDQRQGPSGLQIENGGVKKKETNQENGNGNCEEHQKAENTNAFAAQFCQAKSVGFDFVRGHCGDQEKND